MNGHRVVKIRKKFHQLFEEKGLSLETECNLKTVNYLNITLNLNTGTYKPYRKPNDKTLYIHAKSNHPGNILKQLPISIEIRLSNLSSNPGIFHEASKHYQNILNQSAYDYKLQYKPPNNEKENKSKSSKNRKRNIIWFNTPFSKNISNNNKQFLLSIQSISQTTIDIIKYSTKNNVKISYSCMENIKSIINMHNKEEIAEKKTQAVNCDCINKHNCPLPSQCQITNIIYKAKITSNLQNYHGKIHYETSKGTFT